MDHLALYREICEYNAVHGCAVPIGHIKEVTKWSPAKMYRILKQLKELGFIERVQRGFYCPVNVYQWHMDDYIGGNNA